MSVAVDLKKIRMCSVHRHTGNLQLRVDLRNSFFCPFLNAQQSIGVRAVPYLIALFGHVSVAEDPFLEHGNTHGDSRKLQ